MHTCRLVVYHNGFALHTETNKQTNKQSVNLPVSHNSHDTTRCEFWLIGPSNAPSGWFVGYLMTLYQLQTLYRCHVG